MLLFSGVQHDA